jgi:hypothetical protein
MILNVDEREMEHDDPKATTAKVTTPEQCTHLNHQRGRPTDTRAGTRAGTTACTVCNRVHSTAQRPCGPTRVDHVDAPQQKPTKAVHGVAHPYTSGYR